MGSIELATNLFRITQTEQKLIIDNVDTKKMLAMHITKLVKLLEKQLSKQVELCQKICQNLKKFKRVRKRI